MGNCCGNKSDVVVDIEKNAGVTAPVPVKKAAVRKMRIPAALRASTWNKYIGESKGKTKCLVCNMNDITTFNFECGHVIAESLGGPTTLDNLRPICGQCNRSCGTRHLWEFRDTHFARSGGGGKVAKVVKGVKEKKLKPDETLESIINF
jgi:hypothetical protein